MKAFSATVLVVDDDEDFRSAVCAILEQRSYTVHTASDGIEAINQLQRYRFDVMVLDLQMPRVNGMEVLNYVRERAIATPVVILTAVQDLHVAVGTIKAGAFDFVTKPVEPADLLNILDRALERARLTHENAALRRTLERFQTGAEIIGASRVFVECLDLAARVAPSDSSVLIQGASGTGKELIASFIHRSSPRAEHPLLALNCSAIPESLIESELFGHEKGAFTDAAAARQGLVEVADHGTLFLDEIGEMSVAVQPKLLRFLQTGEYRRVGGNEVRRADVRVISATNRDLAQDAAHGRFREDLFYRLNVVLVQVPSLNDRRDDIPLLASYFIQKKTRAGNTAPVLLPASLEALQAYHWPGNVRELENVLERASLLCRGNEIRPEDLALTPMIIRGARVVEGAETFAGEAITLKQMEKAHIASVLASVGWDKKLAAKILGISLKTLYTKLHQHQIRQDSAAEIAG